MLTPGINTNCIMADIEKYLLQVLDTDGVIEDSESLASTSGYEHKAVVSSIKSLQSYEMINAEAGIPQIASYAFMDLYQSTQPARHADSGTSACRRGATPDSFLQLRGRKCVSMGQQSSECMAKSRGMKGASP